MQTTINLPLFAPPSRTQILCQLTIPGDPVTKARARFHDHFYTEPGTRHAESYIGWAIRKAYPDLKTNRSHDLGVCVAFFTKTRRKDIDNLIKLLLDACNGLVWADDVQVTELASTVLRGHHTPRTEFVIYTIGDGLSGRCETCGTDLISHETKGQHRRQNRFCSKACYDAAQRQGQYVACFTCKTRIYKRHEQLQQARQFCSSLCRTLAATSAKICRHCRQPFRDSTSALRNRSFCSQDCREAWHAHNGTASRKAGICPDCGSPSTHAAQRCYRCHLIHRWGRVPFTPAEKEQIVASWQAGTPMASIAKAYGVHARVIARVIHERVDRPHYPSAAEFLLGASATTSQLELFVA